MDNTNTSGSRIDHIDLLRAIGIIFMIMAHIGFGDIFFKVVHGFHMPLFFFISGFFFIHRDKSSYDFLTELKKKAKTLLLPYVIFGLIQYVIKCIAAGFQTKDLIHLFTVNTSSMPIAGAMWFLTALFFASIIYFLLDRYILNPDLRTAFIIILALSGIFAGNLLSFTLPWALSQALTGLGFFHIGHLTSKYREKAAIKKFLSLQWYLNLLLSIAVCALIFLNSPVDMRLEQYGIIPLFWINACFAIIAAKNYARYLEKYIRKTPVFMWLTGIGKNSIIYLCLNQLMIKIFLRILERFITNEWFLHIIILLLSLSILYFVEKLFTKTPLKIAIGR